MDTNGSATLADRWRDESQTSLMRVKQYCYLDANSGKES